jgi:SAM-dependent methyltransferase
MSERWDEGESYERFMGRWSRLIAERFVAWLEAAPGAAWLDVGCGTGALLETILRAASPGPLAGIDPSAGFLASAAGRLPAGTDLRVASALPLPFEGDAFDAVVSGLVLNFIPDPAAAVHEMRRVARPGGVVSVYVWDYAEGMEFLRWFWDAVTELDPSQAVNDEGDRFPICRPGPLRELFVAAGLSGVESTAIEVRTRFRDFDDYWEPFLAGQGPAGAIVAGMGAADRDALAALLRRRLPIRDDGSIDLLARAWAVRGEEPAR